VTESTSTLQRLHNPVTSSIEFRKAASLFLDKLERAVSPLKSQNEFFVAKRSSNGELGEVLTIDLGPQTGIFQIEVSEVEHLFSYSSPISGNIIYCLSSVTGKWVSIDDGHDFEGIFVRDLIRCDCIGLPNL